MTLQTKQYFCRVLATKSGLRDVCGSKRPVRVQVDHELEKLRKDVFFFERKDNELVHSRRAATPEFTVPNEESHGAPNELIC